jgi:hypothetical protein
MMGTKEFAASLLYLTTSRLRTSSQRTTSTDVLRLRSTFRS